MIKVTFPLTNKKIFLQKLLNTKLIIISVQVKSINKDPKTTK